MNKTVEVVEPGNFEAHNHFYPKALNSTMHHLVQYFLSLGNERIIERYTHLHPNIDRAALEKLMHYKCKHFYWGGADLFYATTETGSRKLIVLETNSCPSGQKSLPAISDTDDYRGYRILIEESFIPAMQRKKNLPDGEFAVIYDKNYTEASGYAATMADLLGKRVFLVTMHDKKNKQEHAYFDDGVLYVKHDNEWLPIRACFRYVTQKPWLKIPIHTKTFIYNASIVCLAGGRNKLLASKAYDLFNSKMMNANIKINTPETIRDVSKIEIPLWVEKFGGVAIVKNPYSNAGQGIYPVTNERELEHFMSIDHGYDQFIVQSLIGHYNWSSHSEKGKYFHIGTLPDKKGNIYIADLRVMVYSTSNGFKPCALYARRARQPMKESLDQNENSWDVLGTNLSVKIDENNWESDTNRLMLMDRKDFNSMGIGMDDLIEGYMQSVLTMIAIDEMSKKLMAKKEFNFDLFKKLDNDPYLHKEIFIE